MTTADSASDVRYLDALTHLQDADKARDELDAVYDDPHTEGRADKIGKLHRHISHSLKAAQVVALLSVADAIAGHADQIMDGARLEEAERLDEAEAAPVGEIDTGVEFVGLGGYPDPQSYADAVERQVDAVLRRSPHPGGAR